MTRWIWFLTLVLLANFSLAHAGIDDGVNFLRSCNALLDPANQTALDTSKVSPEYEAMSASMNKEVIGQPEAVSALANSIEQAFTMMNNPKKPIGSVLLLGPTGVGKTELSKALIKELGGDPDKHVVRVDCTEFQMGHEISRLVGSPAGFTGYKDPPQFHPEELAKRRLKVKTPFGDTMEITVIRFDEIEKANDSLFKLMLGILDEGIVTLGDGSESRLRRAFIIGTSNLGADEIEKLMQRKREELEGKDIRQLSRSEVDITGRYDSELWEQMKNSYFAAMKKKYAPEFINRWGQKIFVKHLGPEELDLILDKTLANVQKRIYENARVKVGFLVDPTMRRLLLLRGTDFRYGARELERTVEEHGAVPLGRLMTTQQVKDGDVVMIQADQNEETTWRRYAKGLSREQLAQFSDQVFPGYKLAKVQFDKPAEKAEEFFETGYMIAKEESKIGQKLRGELWRVARTHVPPKILEGKAVNGADVKESTNFVYIGERFVRLVLQDDNSVKISLAGQLEEKTAAFFPTDKVAKFSDEQIKEMKAKLEAKEKAG